MDDQFRTGGSLVLANLQRKSILAQREMAGKNSINLVLKGPLFAVQARGSQSPMQNSANFARVPMYIPGNHRLKGLTLVQLALSLLSQTTKSHHSEAGER
mgnify:CR=1 FL=1